MDNSPGLTFADDSRRLCYLVVISKIPKVIPAYDILMLAQYNNP